MTTSDRVQLWLCGWSAIFLATVSTVLWAQSQDAINATLFERNAAILQRLDRIETYNSAIIVATLGNLIAHVLNIRASAKKG